MTIKPQPAEETIILIKDYASKNFKQFDVIAGNHPKFITDNGSKLSNHNQTQLNPETISVIMREWNILKDSLPDSIFVRAYEGTIDLLRAVIIGPPGTPYHHGLFFYDIQITPAYPFTRPNLWLTFPGSMNTKNMAYYRANPCRLLKTENQKQYSILEILLLQQANLLNSEPKPVLDHSDGILPNYFEYLLEKDYSAFDKSCQMMLDILRQPPKHFEEFVAEHFKDHATSILIACKSYIGDGESKAAEYNQCAKVASDSTAIRIYEELKLRQKSMKSIYYRLFNAFKKNGSSTDSLDNIYNIADNDIDLSRSCSGVLLFFSVAILINVFGFLGMGYFYKYVDHDNYVMLLRWGLVMSFCLGMASVLLKIIGCDFALFDDVEYTGYS